MAVNLTNGTIIEDRFMERMAIGALFLGSSLAMLPPYAAVLYVIFSSKQIRTQPFYTIALHMGYSDLGQLLFGPGIYGGLSCLTDAYYPRSFWVKKFMNSCSFFFWFAYVSLAQVMTLNRFVTIFFPANVASLFSRRNTKILMSICWLHGLAWFVWLMMPKVNCAFSVDSYGLDYDTNPESLTALAANSYINISHSSIMVVIYSFICLKMIFERKKVHNEQMINNRKKEERMVMYQALWLCSLDIVSSCSYIAFQYVTISRWATFWTNFTWIFCAGTDSFIFLVFNSTIRNDFKDMLFKRSSNNQNSSSPNVIQL